MTITTMSIESCITFLQESLEPFLDACTQAHKTKFRKLFNNDAETYTQFRKLMLTVSERFAAADETGRVVFDLPNDDDDDENGDDNDSSATNGVVSNDNNEENDDYDTVNDLDKVLVEEILNNGEFSREIAGVTRVTRRTAHNNNNNNNNNNTVLLATAAKVDISSSSSGGRVTRNSINRDDINERPLSSSTIVGREIAHRSITTTRNNGTVAKALVTSTVNKTNVSPPPPPTTTLSSSSSGRSSSTTSKRRSENNNNNKNNNNAMEVDSSDSGAESPEEALSDTAEVAEEEGSRKKTKSNSAKAKEREAVHSLLAEKTKQLRISIPALEPLSVFLAKVNYGAGLRVASYPVEPRRLFFMNTDTFAHVADFVYNLPLKSSTGLLGGKVLGLLEYFHNVANLNATDRATINVIIRGNQNANIAVPPQEEEMQIEQIYDEELTFMRQQIQNCHLVLRRLVQLRWFLQMDPRNMAYNALSITWSKVTIMESSMKSNFTGFIRQQDNKLIQGMLILAYSLNWLGELLPMLCTTYGTNDMLFEQLVAINFNVESFAELSQELFLNVMLIDFKEYLRTHPGETITVATLINLFKARLTSASLQ
jgi:hypothetical protein